MFWDSALFALDAQTQTTLPRLVQRELALPRQDAAADGLREYAFKHAILHQVTYGTVLKRQRKELHAKTARWLAQQTGPRAKGWLGTAAEHFELAGDDVNAAEFYARAAEYTASTFAHESALDYTKRALALMAEGDHELRWRLLAARERTLDLLGQREAQHQDIEALLTLAEILDDDLRRAEAASRRCDIAMRTSDYPTMEREAGRAQALAERAGNEKLALRELHHLAVAIAYQGDPATGRALAEAGLKRAELHADGGLQSLLANAAVICAELQGDRMACLQHALFALAMAHDSGNRLRDAVNLGNVGIGYAAFGDYATARQYIEKALDLNRAVGNRSGEGVNLIMLSDVALQLGECTQALILARAALDIAVAVGARFNQINVLSHLASAELSLGRFAEAAVAFERSEELALEINSTPLLLDALSGAALVALACQDNAQAVRMVERLLEAIHAVANAVVPGGLAGAGQTNPLAGAHEHAIRLTLCRVWSRAGDPRATGAISDAYRVVINEADRISDAALRHSFLTNVPDHNAIVKLWGNAANPSVGAQPRSAL